MFCERVEAQKRGVVVWDRARQGTCACHRQGTARKHGTAQQVGASRLHCYALDINVPVRWIRLTGVVWARFLRVAPRGSFLLDFLAIGVPVQAECVSHYLDTSSCINQNLSRNLIR